MKTVKKTFHMNEGLLICESFVRFGSARRSLKTVA
jgi:hypothetical protein